MANDRMGEFDERMKAKGAFEQDPEPPKLPNGDGRRRTRPNSDYGADEEIMGEAPAEQVTFDLSDWWRRKTGSRRTVLMYIALERARPFGSGLHKVD